jgi:hypothetical protein
LGFERQILVLTERGDLFIFLVDAKRIGREGTCLIYQTLD